MSLVHWLSVAGFRVAVSSSTLLAKSAALGIAAGALGLAGCALFANPSTEDMYPKMTADAQAVRVYYEGEKPECQEIINLGRVQAKAGGYPDPLFPGAPVNMDVALAWLRQEAWKKGANGVRLIEHKGNSDASIHMAIGEAVFCRRAN
jgi:hypothetical protein